MGVVAFQAKPLPAMPESHMGTSLSLCIHMRGLEEASGSWLWHTSALADLFLEKQTPKLNLNLLILKREEERHLAPPPGLLPKWSQWLKLN